MISKLHSLALFGLSIVFASATDGNNPGITEVPEDLFGLLGIFPIRRPVSKPVSKPSSKGGKGKRALAKKAEFSEDEITKAYNNLSPDGRQRALALAQEGDKEELFGLLGLFPFRRPVSKPVSKPSKKGKRNLVTSNEVEEVPEDLFGLLGIFPIRRPVSKPVSKPSSKGGKGKRALANKAEFSEDEITKAYNNLSPDGRQRALALAQEGDKEELFGLLGLFPFRRPVSKPVSKPSKKGKRNLVTSNEVEEVPEDLFGLLGIFPIRRPVSKPVSKPSSKGGKGKRVLANKAEFSEDEITKAYNKLSPDGRQRALVLAQEGDKEELFGLLGLFPFRRPVSKPVSKPSKKGKRRTLEA